MSGTFQNRNINRDKRLRNQFLTRDENEPEGMTPSFSTLAKNTIAMPKLVSSTIKLKIILGALGIFLLMMLMMISILVISKIDVMSFIKKDPEMVEKETFKYIDEVTQKYQNDGIEIDRNLLLATITTLKNMDEYADESFFKAIVDRVTNKEVRLIKESIDIASAYQIKTIAKCKYPSNTPREIAMNDKSGFTSFFLSEAKNERNYECHESDVEEEKVLSIEEGNFDDDSSGGVFFWNMYDGEFIENYFQTELEGKTPLEIDNFKKDFIEFLYDQKESFDQVEFEESD